MHEKGQSLGRAFYEKAVVPLLPKIPHAAAFLGPGSDVLGFDDATSTDHDWGPRCRLFVRAEADYPAFEQALKNLPETFAGHPVWFGRAEDGVSVQGGEGRAHLVRVHTIEGYLDKYLGLTAPESDLDWLCLPDQRLLEWTGGEVFHDAIGLTSARSRFAALPENVRMYRIAASWANISEEAAFVGRTGDVGDDIGSRIVAARLGRRAMLLAFLLEGRYPPYSKWLGTAFRQLGLAARMQPVLESLLSVNAWQDRVAALGKLWDALIDRQSELLGEPIEKAPAPYRNEYWTCDLSRPFEAARCRIRPPLDRLPPGLGSVNEWLDNTPVMDSALTVKAALRQYTESTKRK